MLPSVQHVVSRSAPGSSCRRRCRNRSLVAGIWSYWASWERLRSPSSGDRPFPRNMPKHRRIRAHLGPYRPDRKQISIDGIIWGGVASAAQEMGNAISARISQRARLTPRRASGSSVSLLQGVGPSEWEWPVGKIKDTSRQHAQQSWFPESLWGSCEEASRFSGRRRRRLVGGGDLFEDALDSLTLFMPSGRGEQGRHRAHHLHNERRRHAHHHHAEGLESRTFLRRTLRTRASTGNKKE